MPQPVRTAGYSGTPLAKKLGITEGVTVALIGADEGWTIPALPPGVRVRTDRRARPDVTLWFVRSHAELARGMARMASFGGARRLWICWPKKASGMDADVSESDVRAAGLDVGLVDYKIAAIDDTWSGLLFTERRS